MRTGTQTGTHTGTTDTRGRGRSGHERATRRAVLVGAAAGGAALVAGCGAAGDGGAAPAGPRPDKAPVTVEYWTTWAPARLDVVRPHLPVFEQRSGSIKAELTTVSDFRPKLRTAIVAGTPPDASIGEGYSAALYGDQRVLQPLDPLLKRDRLNLQRDYVLNGFEHWCGPTPSRWTASRWRWSTTRPCSASA